MWTPDPTTNRLPAPYQYDAAGNMTNDSFNTYAFDAVNRIKQVTSNGATYSYDGNSLRVQRTASGTTTTYVFSGTKVIAEYAGGALSKEYIYAGSQLLATVDASTGSTSYQHPDHLSTRVETGSNAGPTRTFGHYPYGEIWYETGTASKWKFTSYERDSESNLDYAMARHYSNVVARFMSPDPLAGTPPDPQTWNRYAYVLNNPISNVDPLGLSTTCDDSGCHTIVWAPSLDVVTIHIGMNPYDDLFVCHGQVWCNGPVVSQNPPTQQQQFDKKSNDCMWKALGAAGLEGLKAAVGLPKGVVDPTDPVGAALDTAKQGIDVLKTPAAQAAIITTAGRWLTQAGGIELAETLAKGVPILGEIVIAGQVAWGAYQGIQAYKETYNQCMGD